MSGLCAGAMGQFVASPTDLVKVRMQMEGRRRLEGKPPRYVLLKLKRLTRKLLYLKQNNELNGNTGNPELLFVMKTFI